MLKCQKAKGSNQNVKCPENVGKGQKKGGGATLKIKKYTIQNVDYFEIGGGGFPSFRFFPHSNDCNMDMVLMPYG